MVLLTLDSHPHDCRYFELFSDECCRIPPVGKVISMLGGTLSISPDSGEAHV